MKKYFLTVTSDHGHGQIVFNHSSDDPRKLVKLYLKEAYDSNGAMFGDFYFGRMDCNFDFDAVCELVKYGF